MFTIKRYSASGEPSLYAQTSRENEARIFYINCASLAGGVSAEIGSEEKVTLDYNGRILKSIIIKSDLI